jgi:hypothetical protein
VTDQQAISYLLAENGRLARNLQRCRAEARRQRLRAELWRQRAMRPRKRR